MDPKSPDTEQREAEPAAVPSSPAAVNRVVEEQPAPPRTLLTAGRRWTSTAAFTVVALAAALAAILAWTQVPFASIWIGAAAIVIVLLAGLMRTTRLPRSRNPT